MDLLEQTKQLCSLYNIKPARSLGQNFLINKDVYNKIIEVADLEIDDVILEVGPGLGFLTTKLAEKVKKVVAVELDDKLADVLKTGLITQGIRNVVVVNKDILKFSIFNFQFSKKSKIQNSKNEMCDARLTLDDMGYKIVANLPYNITSIFLRKFLSGEFRPELMVLLLQKEVAERIVAQPPKMSLLAVSVQYYAKPEIIRIVPANNFWPKPEVDSAIIKLKVKSEMLDVSYKSEIENRKSKIGLGVDKEREFFRLVKIGFSSKRKMLKNNLAAGYRISQIEAENKLKFLDFNPKIRAQELSADDWLRLFGAFQ